MPHICLTGCGHPECKSKASDLKLGLQFGVMSQAFQQLDGVFNLLMQASADFGGRTPAIQTAIDGRGY